MPAFLGSKPLFDRKIQIVKPVLPEIATMDEGVHSILQSGSVTKGKYLEEFENRIAEHLNVKHAVGVSSCTTGLMLGYQALGLTGEVIVPSFTFMASVSSLVWCGLKPVFVDVDAETTNIDPELIHSAISPRTCAIVAVHNFGNPAQIMELVNIAQKYNLMLIFDAAHGFGSLYGGNPVGSQGDLQVFSMSPTKLLITGEGGIVATNDDLVANRVRIGREYGNDGNYGSVFAGINARLAEFNSLLGIHSLDLLESAAQSRNKTAERYRDQLADLPGIGFQKVSTGNRSSYKDFSITVEKEKFGLSRDELGMVLSYDNIDTRKYYSPPVHLHAAYKEFRQGTQLENTLYLSETSLSLPIWTNMDETIIDGICDAIRHVFDHSKQIQNKLTNKVVGSK